MDGTDASIDYDLVVSRVLDELESSGAGGNSGSGSTGGSVGNGGDDQPKPPNKQRILYFTSNYCEACEPLDQKVEQWKSQGLPITIITLQQRDTEVYQVPQVFVPSTGKSVIGMNNVEVFFLDYSKEGNSYGRFAPASTGRRFA